MTNKSNKIKIGEVVVLNKNAASMMLKHNLELTTKNLFEDPSNAINAFHDYMKVSNDIMDEIFIITELKSGFFRKLFKREYVTVKPSKKLKQDIELKLDVFYSVFTLTGMTYESYNILYNN